MLAAMTKTSSQERTGGGLVSIAVPTERITRPIFGKRGFVSGALVVDWPAVIKSAIASFTLPVRITFPANERANGTLVIKVSNSAFATELQHLAPQVIERINSYFGWNAVARIKLIHGPLPQDRQGRKKTSSAPADGWGDDSADQSRLARVLDGIDDPALRQALEGLGRRVLASGKKPE